MSTKLAERLPGPGPRALVLRPQLPASVPRGRVMWSRGRWGGGRAPGILLNWGRRCYKAPRKSAPASTPDIPSVLFRPRGDAGYVGALKIIAGPRAGIPRSLYSAGMSLARILHAATGGQVSEVFASAIKHKDDDWTTQRFSALCNLMIFSAIQIFCNVHWNLLSLLPSARNG